MKDLIYTEHEAGTFEDGIQICVHCLMILCDYTSGAWDCIGGEPKGFIEGPLYITGVNPRQYTTVKPKLNYGGGDPYLRKFVLCTDR
jgi:hypothetical protein